MMIDVLMGFRNLAHLIHRCMAPRDHIVLFTGAERSRVHTKRRPYRTKRCGCLRGRCRVDHRVDMLHLWTIIPIIPNRYP